MVEITERPVEIEKPLGGKRIAIIHLLDVGDPPPSSIDNTEKLFPTVLERMGLSSDNLTVLIGSVEDKNLQERLLNEVAESGKPVDLIIARNPKTHAVLSFLDSIDEKPSRLPPWVVIDPSLNPKEQRKLKGQGTPFLAGIFDLRQLETFLEQEVAKFAPIE